MKSHFSDLIPTAVLGKQTLRITSPYMQGADVTDAQQRLIAAGHNLSQHGADGIYGPETQAAVKAFQAANNLAAHGIVGSKTWLALYAVTPGGGSPQPQPVPGGYTPPGSNGENEQVNPWVLIGAAVAGIFVMARIVK